MAVLRRRRLLVLSAVVSVGLIGVAGLVLGPRALDGRGRFCTGGASIGTETWETPEGAFAAWWAEQDPEALRARVATDPTDLPDLPRAEDFGREGRNYRWPADGDIWVQVDIEHPMAYGEVTSDGWVVAGANRCSRVPA